MIRLKDLISEITSYQKERKKDYLFKHSGLHSSNVIPSFEEVWKDIVRSDGFKNELEAIMGSREDDEESFGNEESAIREIRIRQEEKYEDIVYSYKELDNEWCWRNVILHESVDPRTHSQLGIYWAIDERSAEAHWGFSKGNRHLDCTYQALIELKNVDWPGTIFSRMDMSIGDDENEIRFLKNAPLMVRQVHVFDKRTNKSATYFINDRRRA